MSQKALEEAIQRSKNADEALGKLQDQLSPARLKEAGRLLQEGDTTAAEQVFDEVVEKEGKSVALAAYQSGQLAEGRVDYPKAMRQYRKAVALEEDNLDYLLAAGKMARTVADYNHAQEWLAKAVAIMNGRNDEDRCHSCAFNDLAVLYLDMGRYVDAESLLKDDLVIKEQGLSKDNPNVVSTLNNLAELYRHQGHYEEAEPLYMRSLTISENKLGKDHPLVATLLNNLATLYYAQDRYEEAESLYKRSREIKEKKLGKNHPDVAALLNNLAWLYYEQGRYKEAEPLYMRVLDISKKTLDKEHPLVAITLNNLAGLYKSQGNYKMAESLYKRSLRIREKVLGKKHPAVASPLNNLALLYKSQGRYEEAEPLYKRSLVLREDTLGKGHPNVAQSLNNFAGLYESQGRPEKAEPLYKRLLEITGKPSKRVIPTKHLPSSSGGAPEDIAHKLGEKAIQAIHNSISLATQNSSSRTIDSDERSITCISFTATINSTITEKCGVTTFGNNGIQVTDDHVEIENSTTIMEDNSGSIGTSRINIRKSSSSEKMF